MAVVVYPLPPVSEIIIKFRTFWGIYIFDSQELTDSLSKLSILIDICDTGWKTKNIQIYARVCQFFKTGFEIRFFEERYKIQKEIF